MELFQFLKPDAPPVEVTTSASESALELFEKANYETDDCSDAKLRDVVYYLRGCRGLVIPSKWRPLLPSSI